MPFRRCYFLPLSTLPFIEGAMPSSSWGPAGAQRSRQALPPACRSFPLSVHLRVGFAFFRDPQPETHAVLPSRCAPEEQPAPHHCIPVFRSFQIPTLSSSAPGAPPSLVLSADLTKPYLRSITQPISENTEQRQNGRKERQRDAAGRAAVVKLCIRGGTENNAEDPAPQPTLRERPACHGQDWPSWEAAP